MLPIVAVEVIMTSKFSNFWVEGGGGEKSQYPFLPLYETLLIVST